MRRIFMAGATCVLAIALIAAPGVTAKKKVKKPRNISGTVTVTATSPVTVAAPLTLMKGNVQAQASCRKSRTVHLRIVNQDGTPVAGGLDLAWPTGPNGDFEVSDNAPTEPGTYTLKTTVDGVFRKSGKGKNAKKFNCLPITGPDVPVVVNP